MWHKIYFNKQNIQTRTAKAVLVKMPNSSAYSGMFFWHPAKLVRTEGGKGYHMSLSFTDEFEFSVFRESKNTRQKTVITLSPGDIKKAFQTVHEQLTAGDEESYLLVESPEKIEVKGEVDECLKNK